MVSYEQELATHLRVRGIPGDKIADITREIESLSLARNGLIQQFGTPQEYAARYPRENAQRRHNWPMYIGALLAVAWIAATLLAERRGWPIPLAGSGFRLLPAIGLMILGMAMSFVSITRKRPRPFV